MSQKKPPRAKGIISPILDTLATTITEVSSTATENGIALDDVIERAMPAHVIILRSEYDEMKAAMISALNEEDRRDLEDAIAGRGDYLPAAMVNRLVAGKNPIREWRRHRNMTALALAEAVGIGKSFLSQIENGKKSPGVGTLKALAHALDCTMDDLV